MIKEPFFYQNHVVQYQNHVVQYSNIVISFFFINENDGDVTLVKKEENRN